MASHRRMALERPPIPGCSPARGSLAVDLARRREQLPGPLVGHGLHRRARVVLAVWLAPTRLVAGHLRAVRGGRRRQKLRQRLHQRRTAPVLAPDVRAAIAPAIAGPSPPRERLAIHGRRGVRQLQIARQLALRTPRPSSPARSGCRATANPVTSVRGSHVGSSNASPRHVIPQRGQVPKNRSEHVAPPWSERIAATFSTATYRGRSSPTIRANSAHRAVSGWPKPVRGPAFEAPLHGNPPTIPSTRSRLWAPTVLTSS
jgi:hypothetical protein